MNPSWIRYDLNSSFKYFSYIVPYYSAYINQLYIKYLEELSRQPKKSLTENHCTQLKCTIAKWNLITLTAKCLFGRIESFQKPPKSLCNSSCFFLRRSPCMPNLTILVFYCPATKTSEKNISAKKRDPVGYRRNVKFCKKFSYML